MQQKLVEHKLRKIQFEYDDTKPWTEQDENLLNAFIGLHDYELERKTTGQELMKQYSARDKEIENAREVLKKVKETFAATRQMADHLVADVAYKKSHAVEKFYEAVNTTNDAIQEYDKIMRAIGDEALDKQKEKYFEEEENHQAWEVFETATNEHYNNYEVNAIDIVSFDKADEAFKTYLSVVINSGNSSAMDYMNEVIHNYNLLMLETEVQYELWQEFTKRIFLIEKITGSDSGTAYFNMN